VRRKARGVTLLELMVASAMALLVVTAATSAILLIIRTLNRSGQSSAMVAEVQLLSEFLVAQLQGVGGGAVRPWMVVAVENGGGVNDTDVITFGDVPATSPTSTTIMAHLSGGTFSLFVPEPRRGQTGRCGLADLRKDLDHDGLPEPLSNVAASYSADELRNREVILVSPSGDTWRSVVLSEAGLEPTLRGCFVRFNGSDAGLVANGSFAAADNFTSAGGQEDLQQWVGGQVAFVRARQWRVEAGEGGRPSRLVERFKEDGPAKERVLFEGVVDLQLALGYDFEPFDGVLTETVDGRDDEWVNQGVNDSHRITSIPRQLGDRDISRELIRMIEIGVVVVLPRAERQLTVRAFDGPLRTGPEARVVGGRAYLRNLLLFL
jgi:Tfp pilus assembly protein PilE